MVGAAPDTEGRPTTLGRDTPDTHTGTPSVTLRPTDSDTCIITDTFFLTSLLGWKEVGEEESEEEEIVEEGDDTSNLAAF